MIIEDYIEKNSLLYPDKIAIVCGGEQCTYKKLQERVSRRVDELHKESYNKGQIVCLRALPSINYLVSYFALHKIGCVVAPLEKDIPAISFDKISKELCSYHLSDGAADVLYTTGTTGKSKGVVVCHRTIIADAENLIDGQGFSHELAFVVNGPLNHIGSLSKIYPVLMLGGTIVIVDGLKDMELFFKALNYPAAKVATFLVPASIRILIQLCASKLSALADKIDFIETGAAAISQSDMESLCRLLPKTRLYNTYASTETGIISTYNYNDGKCMAGCLGKPMKHSEFFITEDGHIACKGDTIMSGYVGDPEKTSTVLRNGIIYTSDMGVIDDEGMLHLKGREDDVINVGGFKVSPVEVEDVALSYYGINDCICTSVDHKITGRALKLLVVMKKDAEFNKKDIALFLRSKLESYKVPLLYDQVNEIKRTFNGKPDRKYYNG